MSNREIYGTPRLLRRERNRGACFVTESEYNTRVPAKSAWFPADKTDVRITVLMKEAAIPA